MQEDLPVLFKDKIVIFTDGACRGNQSSQNHGGWGAVMTYNGKTKTLSGYEKDTTNNRMELSAVIEAFKTIKDPSIPIMVFSDSSYVINCFLQNWYLKWQTNGWKNSKKEPVENSDLWKELIGLSNGFKSVSYYRIKGHLDLKKVSEVKKWHKKIDEINGLVTSDELYYLMTKMNHMADDLANQGIDNDFDNDNDSLVNKETLAL